MRLKSIGKWVGALASAAGAYALVLNLFLFGVLSAPRADALAEGYVLCLTSPDGQHTPDGKTGAIHCPICIARGMAIGLPPVVAAFGVRLGASHAMGLPVVSGDPATQLVLAAQPRGPPALS
ncbi:MAG: hypothetical protein J0I16_07615 [Rhizobiales bacterium]|nr:hypothetical protein [Hyphomicrobiales bacterium]